MYGQILLFHFADDRRLNALRKALLPVKVMCRIMEESDWDAPLGAFLHLSVSPQSDAPAPVPITEEMMVICGVSQQGLGDILGAMRRANIAVPYKATLTPTNKDWTPRQLFAELQQEHAMIQQAKAEEQEE